MLAGTAFVKESQRYPDDFRPRHVLATAPRFFERWDADFADRLVDEFRLPLRTRVKLSRGQLSAVGVIVGLAARAPITLFDEPYLGLDAVARQRFYDLLLADYAEHPHGHPLHPPDRRGRRPAGLVLVINEGRIIIDAPAEAARTGDDRRRPGGRVEAFTAGRAVLHREGLGALASVTVDGVTAADRAEAQAAGLELAPSRCSSSSSSDHRGKRLRPTGKAA